MNAFPQHDAIANEFHPKYGKDRGMTLRDYFAAKAMQAMIGNELDCTTDALAGRAYVVADAMIKAREA